jgi:hypothetical protein
MEIHEYQRRGSLDLAPVQVEVPSQPRVGGINSLEPAIHELMQIIQVVLAEAASVISRSPGVIFRHSLTPAIVCSDGLKKRTTGLRKGPSEILGTSSDVEVGVLAVTIGGSTTFIHGNLHQSLFARTASDISPARRFLHSKRRKEDRRDSSLAAISLEQVNIRRARTKWISRRVHDVSQVLDYSAIDVDIRRSPASSVDTTVEPPETTIGACYGSSFGRGTWIAAVALDLDRASIVVITGGRGRGGGLVLLLGFGGLDMDGRGLNSLRSLGEPILASFLEFDVAVVGPGRNLIVVMGRSELMGSRKSVSSKRKDGQQRHGGGG